MGYRSLQRDTLHESQVRRPVGLEPVCLDCIGVGVARHASGDPELEELGVERARLCPRSSRGDEVDGRGNDQQQAMGMRGASGALGVLVRVKLLRPGRQEARVLRRVQDRECP